jgi:hypothetical protein
MIKPGTILEFHGVVFAQVPIGSTLMPQGPRETECSALQAGLKCGNRDGMFLRIVSDDVMDLLDDISVAHVELLCVEIENLHLCEVCGESTKRIFGKLICRRGTDDWFFRAWRFTNLCICRGVRQIRTRRRLW